MTIPEYDEECQCQVCKDDRENRRRRMQAWNDRKIMIEVTSKQNCGTCLNESCDWWTQREQVSRINTMVNREYVDHFSMRLATEMAGCRCYI